MSAPGNIRVPAIDVVVESALWNDAAEAAVRRAIEEAAAALGADFRNQALAVLLTDDAAVRRLKRNGAASTSRPTCCRSRRPPCPATRR